MVTHDRYFLDKTANKIWELSPKELKEYEGNYTSYKLQKEIQTRNTLKEYDKQQREIKHLNEVINDRKTWFDKAHKAAGQDDFRRAKSKKHVSIMRAKEKQLERIESNKIDRPKEDVAACFEILNKKIDNAKLPQYLVQGSELDKSYGQRIILSKASFSIMRGDKIALLGQNGAGKTTLIKMLNGVDNSFKGTISINPSVKIGYFAQELDNLDYDKSILENVLYYGINHAEARMLLACLLFKGDEVFKLVKNLSMGEKCRTAFAKIILSEANLLVLDELTNYMDILSKEKIEEILCEFKGTILFVSHDRYFVNRLATKIIEINNEKLISYPGTFDEYISRKQNSDNNNTDYNAIRDIISKLECELAFLSGKFNEKQSEDEKAELDRKFLEISREINAYRLKL
jgi:ATPase subunit of ABC transporter with duplicated ATPase domains